jgi:sec-independent protein translocase protein TatB
MFDVSSSEFLLVMIIALVVIGPKDLPKVLRVVGKWVSKARAVTAQFRSGFDEMVRESELQELEQKWKAENERIMAEHPMPTTTDEVKIIEKNDGVPKAKAKSKSKAKIRTEGSEPGPGKLL